MALSAARQRAQDRAGSRLMRDTIAEQGSLKQGHRHDAVRALERALQVVGFDPGSKDNKFTNDTARAVKEFQSAWGMPATGELDEPTLNKLDHTLNRARKHGSACPDCNKKGFQGTVGIGQKNADVFEAERHLKKLGYSTGKVDGVFDRETQDAVQAFKKDQPGIDNDSGSIGRGTMEALREESRRLSHMPYRRRITSKDGAAEHRKVVRTTADAARRSNDDGTRGIGEGSSKRDVENVQTYLRSAGFDPKRTDGVWDERTENALRTFQKRADLPVTGRVDRRTWDELQKSRFVAKDGTSPGQTLGERSAAVLRSEKLFKKMGYDVKVDGIFDRETQQASRAFERRFDGMGKDGAIGENQLERMQQVARAKNDPGSGPLLKKGFRGGPVKALQRRLDAMGFNPGAADGDFGKKTEQAVKDMQRAFGLKPDGVVGRQTWKMLGIDVKGEVRKPGGGGDVSAGGGWGGSQGVANAAKGIAANMGIPVTSEKRNYAQTVAVGSSTASDHYTGNTTAYAVDFGVAGSRGDQLAQAIARKYGIPESNIGTYNYTYKKIGGQTYRLQLLWRVAGHFDHVHLGIRRV